MDKAGRRRQVHYDDASSLRAKYAVAADLGLRGIGVWTANADYLAPLAPNHITEQRALFATLDAPTEESKLMHTSTHN